MKDLTLGVSLRAGLAAVCAGLGEPLLALTQFMLFGAVLRGQGGIRGLRGNVMCQLHILALLAVFL